MIQNSGTW